MKLLKTRFKKDIVEIVSGNAQGSELDLSYIPAQQKNRESTNGHIS